MQLCKCNTTNMHLIVSFGRQKMSAGNQLFSSRPTGMGALLAGFLLLFSLALVHCCSGRKDTTEGMSNRKSQALTFPKEENIYLIRLELYEHSENKSRVRRGDRRDGFGKCSSGLVNSFYCGVKAGCAQCRYFLLVTARLESFLQYPLTSAKEDLYFPAEVMEENSVLEEG